MNQQDPWAEFRTGPAQQSAPQTRRAPGVIQGPPAAPDPREAERAAAERERLRLAQEANARSAQANQRAAESHSRDMEGGVTASASESERKAGAFLIRALGSNETYMETGQGPRSLGNQVAFDLLPNVTNYVDSSGRQVAQSAQDEFIAASLRQDSGAAIPEQEMERQRRIYFPMPGDGPEVIAQKREARLRAIEGLRQSAGRLEDSAQARYDALFSDQPVDARNEQQDSDPTNIQPIGPTPTTQDYFPNGGEFGMDTMGQDNPFDRIEYLQENFGITPEGETQLIGQLNARAGNPNLTRDDVLQVYRQLGISPPADEGLEGLVNDLRQGRVGGIDTSGAEEQYRGMLSRFNEQEGRDDYGVGSLAIQGAGFGFGDELEGAAQAVGALASGENPVAAYQVHRDSVRLGLEDARERTGALGTVAEIGGSVLTGGIRAAPTAMRASAPVRAAAREGAILGGVAGAGYGEGVAGTATNALLGSTLGAGAGATLQAGAQAIAPRIRNALARDGMPNANEVAPIMEAGQRRGVTVRRADVDPSVRSARGDALQGAQGERLRAAEQGDLEQLESALLRDLSGGASTSTHDGGTAVQTGVASAIGRMRARASSRYAAAERLAPNVRVEPRRAIEAVDAQIAELGERGANQNSSEIAYLTGLREDLARDGGISIDALRSQRSGLGQRLRNNNLYSSDFERRLGGVFSAASEDIAEGLADNPRALQLFQEADSLWRRQAETQQNIGRALLGNPNNPKSASDTAATVLGYARKDPRRLSSMLDIVDDETRGEVRAMVAGQLGRSANGDFSVARLLSQTGEGSATKLNPRATRALFGEDGARAIRDLRTLAGAKVAATNRTNYSNTGNVVRRAGNNLRRVVLGGLGIADGGATGGATMVVGGELFSRLGEGRAMRMLLNPDFTRWLRKLPNSSEPKVIDGAFGNLRRVASRNSAFLSDVTALERALLGAVNDNAAGASRAVAEEPNEQQ